MAPLKNRIIGMELIHQLINPMMRYLLRAYHVPSNGGTGEMSVGKVPALVERTLQQGDRKQASKT